MYVTKIKIADLVIQMECNYAFTGKLCADYIVDSSNVDFTVSISKEEIQSERNPSTKDHPAGYLESLCVYREICKKLFRYDAFLFHAAVIAMNNHAYAFTAKSGTGKTTHISLWMEQYGNQVEIINGDKPIMRFREDGKLYAYGTPWCGKERMHTNRSAPLKAIAFIERGRDNHIERIESRQIMNRLFHQVLLPKDTEEMNLFLDMVERMVKITPCYLLTCNMDQDAAKVAYCGMSRTSSAVT